MKNKTMLEQCQQALKAARKVGYKGNTPSTRRETLSFFQECGTTITQI